MANELRKLQQLHEQGLLNAQEFEEQKRQVLR
ncbi:SHOCT domain-containing protein [Hymenobacter wooponensis]|nr:SHOCT domain-containing protein [Hymenobacter wooponensis]